MKTQIIKESIADFTFGKIRKYNRIISQKRERYNRERKEQLAQAAQNGEQSCSPTLPVIQWALPKQNLLNA